MAAVLLLLALGIGANTAIFSLLDAIFLHPLPVPHPHELIAVYQTVLGDGGEPTGFENVSFPNYRDFRDRNHTFSGLALYQWFRMNLSGGPEPARIAGMFVTANYFDVLGLRPARGRFFRPEEDRVPGTEAVVVLSHGCWRRDFGGDPKIVGRTVRLNGRPFVVIGVAPERFRGTDMGTQIDAWVPFMMFPAISPYPKLFESRDDWPFRVIGRLRPGVSPARAGADLSEIARDLERRFPKENERLGVLLRPLVEGMIVPRERDRYLGYGRTLSFAALLLLVVASANLANLLLARGLERGRELSIRHAVGGGLGSLARLLVIESLLLFLLGGLLGVPVGAGCLRLLWSFRPPELEAGGLDLRLDPAIFGGTLLFTLGAMLLFGVLPALRLTRLNLAASLREARAPEAAPGLWHPRRLLVAGQLALTLFALIGANLLLESLMRARQADLGFRPEPLLVLTVSPGDQGYGEAGARDYYRRLLETVSALPGVRSASLSENRLLRGAVLQRAIYPEGRPEGLEANGRSSHRVNSVTPGFFQTAGIPLLRGRDFSGMDCAACKRVAIVNQTLARLAWPGQDPVGRRFRFDDPGAPPVEVVGIARDAKYRYVHEDPQPFVYLPLSQSFAPSMTLHVRAGSRPEALLPTVRRAAQAADPGMPLADVDTMDHQVAGALWMERASTLLLSLFGLLALLLSGIGIYSVMGLSVTRRQREIAIRLALGSGHRQVVARVMAEAAALAAAGLLTGGTAAWFFLEPVVASQLGGAGARSPGAYAAQSLVLLATAAGASLPAAWRAARISPMLPLREG